MGIVNPDWSDPASEPGIKHARVKAVEQKKSKNGDLMLGIEFDVGGAVVYDNLMLEGKGRIFGIRRLEALGLPKGEPFDTNEIVGRFVELACIVEEYIGRDGATRKVLKVDGKASADGFVFGYRKVESRAIDAAGEVPF